MTRVGPVSQSAALVCGAGAAWLDDATGSWSLQAGFVDDGEATAFLEHFSTFSAGYDSLGQLGVFYCSGNPSPVTQDMADATCQAVGVQEGTHYFRVIDTSDDLWNSLGRHYCASSDEILAWWWCDTPELPGQEEFDAAQAELEAQLNSVPTACETLAESFDPVTPLQATLVEGDGTCPSVSVNDVDEYQALLDQLADEDGYECGTEVSVEAEPCGLTRTCSDGADQSATFVGLVNADDDYAGTLQVVDDSIGFDCTYAVSMEEPEPEEPSWEGTELDTENYYRWHGTAWNRAGYEPFPLTLRTSYPGPGEGSVFWPGFNLDSYDNDNDAFNPAITIDWDPAAQELRRGRGVVRRHPGVRDGV